MIAPLEVTLVAPVLARRFVATIVPAIAPPKRPRNGEPNGPTIVPGFASSSGIGNSSFSALVLAWPLGITTSSLVTSAFAPVDTTLETVPWTVSESGLLAKRNFHAAHKCPTSSLLSLLSHLWSLPAADFPPQIGPEMALM
jgi:hypothetical protein